MSFSGTGSSGKNRLMDAAKELFAQYGVDEITVAQILDASGVKAPTLYHHFGGKEGLYVAWAVTVLNQLKDDVADIAPSPGGLDVYLKNVATYLVSNRGIDLSQVLRDRSRLAAPDSEGQIERAIEVAIVRPLAKAIHETVPHLDDRCTAQVFLHLITGARGRYRLSGTSKQPCVEAVVDLFLNGLLAAPVQKSLVR